MGTNCLDLPINYGIVEILISSYPGKGWYWITCMTVAFFYTLLLFEIQSKIEILYNDKDVALFLCWSYKRPSNNSTSLASRSYRLTTRYTVSWLSQTGELRTIAVLCAIRGIQTDTCTYQFRTGRLQSLVDIHTQSHLLQLHTSPRFHKKSCHIQSALMKRDEIISPFSKWFHPSSLKLYLVWMDCNELFPSLNMIFKISSIKHQPIQIT